MDYVVMVTVMQDWQELFSHTRHLILYDEKFLFTVVSMLETSFNMMRSNAAPPTYNDKCKKDTKS